MFWTITVLISAFFILSGYMELTKHPATYPKTIRMGYPPYFITMLGVAKLIGSAVFLVPMFRRLREWVFAAFTIDVIFAFVSGYTIASYGDCIKATVVFIVIMIAYLLFIDIEKRASRKMHLEASY
ncbi:DoxX family protein [Segetibacter sp.]|uniref:DoxX family protein n=1 Tax=Segetibacter sp. TaxID=2231182 RepID=UPI002639CACA|nr:DoxX family protein [Segetibacter sp.]